MEEGICSILKRILGVENPNNHVFQLFFNIEFFYMIGKIVSRKSKNIGSKIEGIFSESKQIIFLVSFVQLKLEQIFTYISHLYPDG